MAVDIGAEILTFIEDNLLFRSGRDALDPSESLLEAGLVDSIGVLELVAFLEKRFGIKVADAEIVPENLDSVRGVTAYVTAKLGREARAA